MDGMTHFERHVVLVSPDVHWNTGNIGRTCLGTNAFLHLVKPLGFSLDSRQVKRAGLDYWPRVKCSVWENFSSFLSEMKPQPNEIALFSKQGKKPFWTMPRFERAFLIFGSETKGLPGAILSKYPNDLYYIPITSEIRSLNLSTAVGVALYETLRNGESFHAYENSE
jgi:tRNA (cytidine/uridine-2'-O-)-methyltransferase